MSVAHVGFVYAGASEASFRKPRHTQSPYKSLRLLWASVDCKGPSGKETRKSTLGVLNLVIKFPPTPMTGDGATCAPSPQAHASLFSARRLMMPSQASPVIISPLPP